jgi:DNA-binding LacI/PurR family transcriptional regulator
MRQFRKATIKDVARRSGVSTTTVSNFVSGNVSVCSPETAARIREAIVALHYVPSSLTRGLRQRSSTTIGVCLPNPLDPDVYFGFSFLERMWRGIVQAADTENYSLLHYPLSVRESESSDAFLDGRVDGLLLSAEDNRRAVQVAAAGMPTVLLTRSLDIPEGCGAVWTDETQTLALALTHLWEQGHRRIACIAGPLGEATSANFVKSRSVADISVQRLEAYVAWMQAHAVYDPSLIAYPQSWSAPLSETYLRGWRSLPTPPTAVVCANDAQARDFIAAATLCGLSVPGDMSVVGIDNSPEARDMNPGLTSVEIPMEEAGSEAVRTLLRLLADAPIEQCRVAIPVMELVVRQSTAPLADDRSRR